MFTDTSVCHACLRMRMTSDVKQTLNISYRKQGFYRMGENKCWNFKHELFIYWYMNRMKLITVISAYQRFILFCYGDTNAMCHLLPLRTTRHGSPVLASLHQPSRSDIADCTPDSSSFCLVAFVK